MKPKWIISIVRYTFNSRWLYRVYIRYKNLNSLFYSNRNTFQIKDVIVCGIHRSGSTLLFNIINEVLRENRKVVDTYFDEEIKYKEILANERSIVVKKNHTYLPLVAKRIRQGKTIGFFTHRDIRDVVVSLMQLGWINSVEDWIANYKIKSIENNAILYASTPNMHVIHYNRLVHAKPDVVKEVADILNVELTEPAIEHICQETSIKNMRKKHESIPSHNQYRYNNQMMNNHIADRETDKWKQYLTGEEVCRLTKHCKGYLDFFGYNSETA